MRIKYVIFLQFLLLFGAVSCEEIRNDLEYDVIEPNNACDSYCFNALKPLIDNAVNVQNKIDQCDDLVQSKAKQIVMLQKQVAELQANITLFKELEALYIEKNQHKDELIAALEQRSSEYNNSEDLIASLKPQIQTNTEAVKLLKTQVSTLNDSIILQNYNAKQENVKEVQPVAINCVPFENSTGIHQIQVPGIGPVSVLCDGRTTGNGWTVIQRRFDGSEDFYRSWSEYRDGVGSLRGEFIMGLETLHRMTSSLPYELYVELTDFSDNVRHARYDNFRIGSEEDKFMLMSLGTYSGTAGDGLTYNLHDKFTTYDSDNDHWGQGNCAKYYGSGGWFGLYANSNLNGKFLNREVYDEESIWWYNWKGYKALKSVKMMIHPKYSSI